MNIARRLLGIMSALGLGAFTPPLPERSAAFGEYAAEDAIAPTRRYRWGSTYRRRTPLEAAKARRARRGQFRELNHLRHITGQADARAAIEMRTAIALRFRTDYNVSVTPWRR